MAIMTIGVCEVRDATLNWLNDRVQGGAHSDHWAIVSTTLVSISLSSPQYFTSTESNHI